jgi:glutaredoxin
MTPRILLAAALLAATPALLAQTTYRWVDERGVVHYSDQPPPQHIRELDQRSFVPGRADPSLPYTVRKAMADFPVTLFTSEQCGEPCARARTWLNEHGVPFNERPMKDDNDLAAYRQAFEQPEEVPALLVGRQPFKGFQAAGWQRLIDDAGYPPPLSAR